MCERLVGGLEVVRELHEQDELKVLLEYKPPKRHDSIGDRFKAKFMNSKTQVIEKPETNSPAMN